MFSQQIYLIFFFGLSLTIFVYSSTKCIVFPNVTLLVHKKFTFYINGVVNCKGPTLGRKGQCCFFLVHKIFTFQIRGVLKFKCPAPGSKG